MAGRVLQPTLWRTCRGLANRSRLRLFRRLLQRPDQTVGALARQMKISLPTASQYLRVLEARGFLSARRVGKQVHYRVSAAKAVPPGQELVQALALVLQKKSNRVNQVFQLATAFTHPRRLTIFRALSTGPQTIAQIRRATGISYPAVARHLEKLAARGFITRKRRSYTIATRRDPLGRVLARLAAR